MSTRPAFEYMVTLQGRNRQAFVYDTHPKPVGAKTVFLAPSNYAVQPAEMEEMVGRGRQFVVIASQIIDALGRNPRRGDIVEDPYLGITTIVMVRELPDMGGAVMGYRIWVE